MIRQLVVDARTVGDVRDLYLAHLRDKGNKPGSVDRTRWALRWLFPDDDVELVDVAPASAQRRYDLMRARLAVDSHRGALAEGKTFTAWCLAEGYLRRDPLAGVRPRGKRSRGKPKPSYRDARRWYRTALALADGDNDDGALAALLVLLCNLRPIEVVTLRARHVDEYADPADTIALDDSKTDSGVRELEVPHELRALLSDRVAGRPDDAWVFPARARGGKRSRTGRHDRGWPNDQVRRICELAGVPRVCAYALRGMHARISFDRGMSPIEVARSMGHSDPRVTREAYAGREAGAGAARRRLWKVLDGGRE